MRTPSFFRRLAHPALPAVVAGVLGVASLVPLVACGGGGGDGVDTAVAEAADATPVSPLQARAGENSETALQTAQPLPAVEDVPLVQLQGCVVDDDGAARAGTQVRVLSADGRLLAGAASDAQGRFTLQAPAQQSVAIAIDGHGSDAMWFMTGREDTAIGECLRDPPL